MNNQHSRDDLMKWLALILYEWLIGFNLMQVYGAALNGKDMFFDLLSQPMSLLLVLRDSIETIEKVGNMLP